MKLDKKNVLVAMSGGVDSSVAAALLKKQGFGVEGVFMKLWKQPLKYTEKNIEPRGRELSGLEAARAVTQKLGIKFHTLDLRRDFKKIVVNYFLAEAKAGHTPNPCVVCNREIKFGLLLKKAEELGADFLATGHYARIEISDVILSQQGEEFRRDPLVAVLPQDDKKKVRLFSAKDKQKDQSYFLYRLNQRQLSKILFPLGDLTKNEVIKLAKKWQLPYQHQPSFDLCFAPGGAEDFVKKYSKLKTGKIIEQNNYSSSPRGEVLGQHHGLALYTIGQRKGLNLSGGPWWVVEKDARQDILYVSKKEKDMYGRELLVEKINWVTGQPPKLPLKVLVKIRYRNEAAEAVLLQIANRKVQSAKQIKLEFKKPQRAITSGQSAVFYSRKDEVLGGGVITNKKGEI